MALYPEVQQRAQEEIDRVVGSDRLPALEDRVTLPYVEAVLLECLRFHPMAPTGMNHLVIIHYSCASFNFPPLAVPHSLREDDVYNGYHIPAGSIVFTNLW